MTVRRKKKEITDIRDKNLKCKTTQMTLDGDECGYTCGSCGKCFATMSDSSRHQHRVHRKIRTSINFVLENYQMQSVKKMVVIQ